MKKQITCFDINGKKFKVSAEKLKFRIGIYGIIIRNGKILLSPQWDGYDFPGGGAETSETIEEALIREVYEETGYKVKVKNVVNCSQSFFKPRFSDEHWNAFSIYYTCVIKSGKISTENFDEHEKIYAKAAQWIDINKTKKLKFYNSVDSVKIIKQAIKKGPQNCKHL